MIPFLRAPYPPVVRLLILAAFGLTLAKAASYPFLARHLSVAFGLDPAMIGLVLGTGPLLGVIAGFLAGSLSDRYGRLPILTVASSIGAFGFVGLALARDLTLVIIANGFVAVAMAAIEPAARALIGDHCPPATRITAFAHRYLATNLGYGIGPLLGAFAGMEAVGSLFLGSAAGLLLIGSLLVWLGRGLAGAPVAVGKGAGTLGAGLRALLRDRRLAWFVSGGILVAVAQGQISVTMAQALGDAVSLFAIVMAANAATVLIASQPVAWLAGRLTPATAFGIGAALLAIGAVGFALSIGPITYVLAMIVFTLGEVFVVPAEFLLVEGIAPASQRGAYHGAQSVTALGTAGGPILGGWALAQAGVAAPFLLFAVLALWAIATIEAGRRAKPPAATGGLGAEVGTGFLERRLLRIGLLA